MSFRGQWGVMEYILTVIVFIILITIFIFFLSWWQITQMEKEMKISKMDKALSIMKFVTNSYLFVKEPNVFDDTKLFSWIDKCEKLHEILGDGWFMELIIFDGKGDVICHKEYNTYCNHFIFCKEYRREYSILPLPVNINKRFGFVFENGIISRTYPGLLKIGVYSER